VQGLDKSLMDEHRQIFEGKWEGYPTLCRVVWNFPGGSSHQSPWHLFKDG